MPTRPKLLVASMLLLAGSIVAPACKPDRAGVGEPAAKRAHHRVEREPPRPRNMPRPLPLPAKAKFAAHVAAPGQALAAIGELVGQGPDPRKVLRTLTAQAPAFTGFAEIADFDRPWSAALVEGQLVIRVALRRDQIVQAKRLLAGKTPVGDFGAVEFVRPSEGTPVDPPPPRLAWLDDRDATITFAGDERGLATGRELAGAYGKHGLFLTLDGAEIRKALPEFPFDRVGLEGKSVADFHVAAEGDGKVQGLDQITEGALTGVLDSPELVAGATSRYAKYESVIKSMISEATRTVDKQNFLVRGVLEDLLKHYKAVLRSWNGRVMVGVGPKGHVVAALGADNPKQGAAAATALIAAVLDNLDLARTFGVSVPRIRFKRNRMVAAGVSIHVVTLENARKTIPAEFAGLLDGEGDLRIAFGGSENAGAVMLAVGPMATESLARWIETTKDATPGHKTKDHLAAASFAIDPGGVPGFAQGEPSLGALLGLSPERAPTLVTAKRKETAFDVHVTGPLPKVKIEPVRAMPARAATTRAAAK